MKLDKKILHTTDSYIKKVADAGISTTSDFLMNFPKDLEDKSNLLQYIKIKPYVNFKTIDKVIVINPRVLH